MLESKVQETSQRVLRAERVGRLKSELLVVRFAHSHSAIQFLPHFPWHWNSNILPPHWGQTKLIIEEMMLALDSPGIASMVLMCSPVRLLPASAMPLFKSGRRLVIEQLSAHGRCIFRTADKHLAGDRDERAVLRVRARADSWVNRV